MGLEIERKFLVGDRSVLEGRTGTDYRQGYLSLDPSRTVRVRQAGEHAFLTIKGRDEGGSRAEFEYEIPLDEAGALLDLCERPLIEKTRYRVDHASLTWEVDVFHGENDGLIVAEVELPARDSAVHKPPWVGEEVTSDPRYFNANLVRRPYRRWT